MESTEAARVEGSDPFQGAARLGDRFLDNIETVVHGKREEIKLVVAALVCGGHVLFGGRNVGGGPLRHRRAFLCLPDSGRGRPASTTTILPASRATRASA